MRNRRNLLTRAARRMKPSPFRVKVAVFMLPLLLPVGKNLSQQPAEADGGLAVRPAPRDAATASGAAGNPAASPAVPPAWNAPEPSP